MADIAKVWTFTSDSNPSKTYETQLKTDGSTSCNCFGWCRRVADDGTRSCKHTRAVDQGVADRTCIASKDYTKVAGPGKTVQKMKTSTPKKSEEAPLPVRKIIRIGG